MVAAKMEKSQRKGLSLVRLVSPIFASVRYIFETEVHAYAFSIAANTYLSFFPFTLILLAICRRWLHWDNAYLMVIQLLRVHLPTGSESIIYNLVAVVQGRPRLQLLSVFMLFFTTSGVFLPLEIALNKVWGFHRNRSFLKNQVVSMALAVVSGLLALGFILAITPLQSFLTLSMGWTLPQALVTKSLEAILEIASVPLVISLYFMIYYFLPNGKVPVGRVLPAALATGILTEVGRGIYSLTHPMVRFREVYGPFGVSVTLLFWAYAGALILLFGAHLSAHGFVAKEETGAVPAPAGSEISALEDNT
ncbi:MAG TPA: YihY/virulence factor BrkB family protein [Terriglobia bacterium]|nr:YihY/virulence factor BrkB family protein [Terriglobia bacterium]